LSQDFKKSIDVNNMEMDEKRQMLKISLGCSETSQEMKSTL